jgi:hypothetical protein
MERPLFPKWDTTLILRLWTIQLRCATSRLEHLVRGTSYSLWGSGLWPQPEEARLILTPL